MNAEKIIEAIETNPKWGGEGTNNPEKLIAAMVALKKGTDAFISDFLSQDLKTLKKHYSDSIMCTAFDKLPLEYEPLIDEVHEEAEQLSAAHLGRIDAIQKMAAAKKAKAKTRSRPLT